MPLPTENEAFFVDLPTENEAFPLEEDEGEKQRYRSINRGTVASSPVCEGGQGRGAGGGK